MSDPLVTEVLSDAAALLGDVAQEQFTNPILLPWYGFAYRELYDVCQRWRLPLAKRTAYAAVAAYQNTLVPSLYGMVDFGEPLGLWERGADGTATISGVSNATPVVVTTSAAHGFTTNAEVQLSGILGPVGVNGQWFITVTGSTTFSLNGSIAGGAYVSGGTVIVSAQTFVTMNPVDELPQFVPSQFLTWWKWQQQRLYFVGAVQARELMIDYTASGTAPQTGTVGIDNSRNFLALRTASLVAPQYDMETTGQVWKGEALGPSMTPDGTGGALRNCVGPMLLAKQNTTKRPDSFRPRRVQLGRTDYYGY